LIGDEWFHCSKSQFCHCQYTYTCTKFNVCKHTAARRKSRVSDVYNHQVTRLKATDVIDTGWGIPFC
jgi:hypothetical protein